MSTTSTVASTTYNTTTRHTLSRRNGRGGIASASTPNLNQVYTAHSSRLAPPALSRKGSVAALTQSSLASIPDDSEAYAFNTVLSDGMPSPLTSGRLGGGDVSVGDVIDVPGNMSGTIRFIGNVAGRKGTFVGVELLPDFAGCGKNSGDVDNIFYFRTKEANTGIFLPISKAIKRDAPAMPTNPYPLTPASGGLKVGTQNSTNFTPPTPGVPKFSQSVGPAARASSPIGKKPTRPSLPRPESPVRRLQMTPAPRPSIGTPASKAVPARYGSPTSNKFTQSVRGTVGDPSKRLPSHTRKGSIGPRSVSVLGVTSGHHMEDDDATPLSFQRSQINGNLGPGSNFNLKVRPASRAASRAGNYGSNNNEEVERLKAELDERDRQLKEQASTLAEMESSLTELQGLIESSDGPLHQAERRGSIDDKDAATLRAVLREKNEKIALLTAEFDAHRADFRSTIDTLEMASTETERVYEKKIEELMQEIQDLQDRSADVDTVANQLKQLEELVQELEEGLEDARRGEAEARSEVEFLRGEVERTRSELRREREKAQSTMNGVNGSPTGGPTSKELEQKEDEIRGLKAIIHSLSRDSVPADNEERTPTHQGESIEDRLSREKLEREVAELWALVESKTAREETLERELETLRRGANAGPGHRGSAMTVGSTNDRNSYRDSRGTVVLAPRSPDVPKNNIPKHSRGNTLDTMPESDSYSTATENSTLWCELCETSGHDILTCTNMFGTEQQQKPTPRDDNQTPENDEKLAEPGKIAVPQINEEVAPAPLSPIKPKPTLAATITPVATPAPTVTPVHTIPNPMESGPVAGKESGVVDADKWCALCERDGHDSVDCPFEDAF